MTSTTLKIDRLDARGRRTVGTLRTTTSRRYIIVGRGRGSFETETRIPYAYGYSDNVTTALKRAQKAGYGTFVVDLVRTRETGIVQAVLPHRLGQLSGVTENANEHAKVIDI